MVRTDGGWRTDGGRTDAHTSDFWGSLHNSLAAIILFILSVSTEVMRGRFDNYTTIPGISWFFWFLPARAYCVGSLKNLMCVRPSSVRPHHFWSILDHVLRVICLSRWFLMVSERVRSVTHRLLSVFSSKIDNYRTKSDSILYAVTSLIRIRFYTISLAAAVALQV